MAEAGEAAVALSLMDPMAGEAAVAVLACASVRICILKNIINIFRVYTLLFTQKSGIYLNNLSCKIYLNDSK